MAWCEALYPWVIHSAIVSLLVLAIGSGAVLLARQPARRVRMIELTLAGCLIAPWLGMIPGYPRLGVTWRVATGFDQDEATLPVSVEQMAGPTVPPSDDLPGSAHILPPEPVAETADAPPRAFDAASWIVAGYGLGVALGLGWWLVGVVGLVRIVRTTWPAPPRCRELLAQISNRRADRVRLLVSRRVRLPFAYALGQPVIVLPEDLCHDEQAQRWCLAHEWTHIERHDFRAWLLAGLGRVLFFYHPLVWWLRRQLRLSQDFFADAQAARQATQAEEYAEFLTARAAAGLLNPARIALGIGFHKSELYRRVIMLVQNRPLESRVPRFWTVSVTCAAFVLVSTVAALSIVPQAAAREEPAATKGEGKPARVDAGPPSSTKSFVAKFSSGITAELLGVSEHPSNANSWWRPDGSPSAKPPCDPLKGSVNSGSDYVGREFAIQWHNLPSEPVGTQVLFDPPYNACARGNPKRLGKSVAGLEAMTVSLPNRQTVTVRVCVAAGPWHTVCETGSGPMSMGTTQGGFAFSPIQEKDGRVTVTVTHDIVGPESRVIAVGLDGREHRATSSNRNGAHDFLQITATFSELSQKDIKVFRVQTRPYDRMEFRNVSLQPGYNTDVQIVHSKTADPSNPLARQTDQKSQTDQPPTTKPEATASTVRGKVIDESGRPVAGAEVWLPVWFSREARVQHAKADSQGRFALVVPSAWLAEMRPWNRASMLWAYAVGHQLSTRKVLLPGSPSDVVIQVGPATDTSFVVLDPQGLPCTGALVEPYYVRTSLGFMPLPEELVARVGARVDGEGRVKLPAASQDVLFQVRISTKDFGIQLQRTDKSQPPAIVAGTIHLRPVGKIEGRMFVGEIQREMFPGQADIVQGVRMVFTTEEFEGNTPPWLAEGFADVTCDEHGRFVVPAIAAGLLEIDILVDEKQSLQPKKPGFVRVRADETTSLEIPMVPTVIVRGSIRTKATRKPVPGAYIHVYYGVGRQGADPVSNALGRYTARVLPGRIGLQVMSMPENYVQLGEVSLRPYEVPSYVKTFDLPPLEIVPAKSIAGRVIDQRGRPAANISISILHGNRRCGSGKSDSNGQFKVAGVPTTINPANVKYDWRSETGSTMPSDCEVVDTDPLILRALPRDPRIDLP